MKHTHSLSFTASIVSVLLLAGCSVKAYDGAMVSEGERSTITVSSASISVSLGEVQIDGYDSGIFGTVFEVLPGEHQIAISYTADQGEDYCDGDRSWCYGRNVQGQCEGAVTTLAGRAYLVTIDGEYGFVRGRVSAKGYFDFSERDDEGEVGHIICSDI